MLVKYISARRVGYLCGFLEVGRVLFYGNRTDVYGLLLHLRQHVRLLDEGIACCPVEGIHG